MFIFKYTVLILKQPSYSRICKRLVSNKVRVRFAPSPTGYLHLGGLRTALYNCLFAKANNGVNILRIEDTDVSRTVPLATENLIDDLAWCGITYDEGPIFQSERKEIYQKYTNQLIDQGDAYYCFCSNVRLDLIRREALKAGQVPKYDNCCRNLSSEDIKNLLNEGKTPCIRFKLSSFTETFDDLIHGPKLLDISVQEGDPVILKSDGFPTYHLANVIDDHLMNITHVLRGMEWLASTTKHILLYRAFKWDPPQFGHFPLLLNNDGTKLSKRQDGIRVRTFRESGYLPDSLINFLTQFGGGFDNRPSKNIRIYTFDELVEKFDITKIRNNSCKVDLKLLPAYNHAGILKLFETESGKKALIKKTKEIIEKHFENSEHKNSLQLNDEHIENVLNIMKDRITSIEALVSQEFSYLWVWENKWNDSNEIYRKMLKSLLEKIQMVNWNQEDLNDFLKKFSKEFSELKRSEIFRVIRLVLTGSEVGPGVGELMNTLLKKDVQFRLSTALGLNGTQNSK